MMFWQIIVRILEIVRTKCAKCILKDDDDDPFTQPLRALQTLYTATQKIQCISDTGRIQSSRIWDYQQITTFKLALRGLVFEAYFVSREGTLVQGDSLTCKVRLLFFLFFSLFLLTMKGSGAVDLC